MDLFLMLCVHHLGDVGLQPSWLIEEKKKHVWAIYEHAMVWTLCIATAMLALGIPLNAGKVGFLLVGHYLMDYAKYHVLEETRFNFYLDQGFHYFQVIVVWVF